MTLTRPFWHHGLPPTLTRSLLLLGALLSILIDLDVLWSPGGLANHHQQFTHWSLTWIVLTIITIILGFIAKKPLLIKLAPIFLLITLLHLALDLFGITIGVPLLAPITRQEFNFIPLHTLFADNSTRLAYVLSEPWIIGRELIIIVISLAIILWYPLKNLIFSGILRLHGDETIRRDGLFNIGKPF